ncbi:hypothetical protein APHAL10511_002459 [Amanita phalloides]|nr:hypothetical protein APHAL10511_002459 [Amanita phalloides]
MVGIRQGASSNTKVKFNNASAEEGPKKLEEDERKIYYAEYQEKVNKVEAKIADYEKKYKDPLDKWPTGYVPFIQISFNQSTTQTAE